MNCNQDDLYAQLSDQMKPDYKLLKTHLNLLRSHNREVPKELLLKLQAMEQLQQASNLTIYPHMYNELATQYYSTGALQQARKENHKPIKTQKSEIPIDTVIDVSCL